MTKPGFPRPRALLRDGAVAVLAQPVASASAALVVALVCLVVLATAGRTAATEHQVLAAIDDTGSRLIAVTDPGGQAGIAAESVPALASIDGVDWAVGFGGATDAVIEAPGSTTGRLPTGVPVRVLVGALPPDTDLLVGRLPQHPGEAVAGKGAARTLGLTSGAGPVTTPSQQAAVVGVVRLTGGLERFADTVLITADPATTEPLRFMFVAASSAAAVPSVSRSVAAAMRATDPSQVTIEEPTAVRELREVVSGRLGAGARQLQAGVLVVGVIVVSITMLAMVAARRRDFGRRRALGASRTVIVILVLTHTGFAATAGALVGTAAGLALVATTGSLPTASYVVGNATLTVLAAFIGATPPAVLASRRDPVRILRVP
ncbi:FtsX-like permease family protein [Xylanimonas protaetiae]|uniref:FtsX-like permease family protein n=1 Tax=Xylanimonas protaetiae TaxID=2509457 RepID=A0A4P6F6M1_9MICO|nr:FtsX-like permease family protein [Xylanimonas protaetiae]QAY71402.1 FtsX-like permease family protein [Xylanimonas protaetiae]